MHIPSSSIFELTLQALPDGVLLIDRDRRVVYANPAFATIWGIPPDLLESGDEATMLHRVAEQLVDPQQFSDEVERLHKSELSSQDELSFRDGRIVSRRSVPFHSAEGLEARIWIFSDVTEARHARLDCLTGLHNRRAFATDFPRFTIGTEQNLKAVALLDVDNFKKYNDTYGHSAGDDVLRGIGRVLRHHLDKADDLLFRVGGEEFIMARNTESELAAGAFFEMIRQAVASLGIPHVGNAPFNTVTASIGIKVFCGPIDAGCAFSRVDEALYAAKKAGRNQLFIA